MGTRWYMREKGRLKIKEKGQLLLAMGFLMTMARSPQLKHWGSGAPGTDLRKKRFSSAQNGTVWNTSAVPLETTPKAHDSL